MGLLRLLSKLFKAPRYTPPIKHTVNDAWSVPHRVSAPASRPPSHWQEPIRPQEPLRQVEEQVGQQIIKGHCWVIDGDTIVINKVHIRLAGIDAPELDHPYGQNAKRTLMALCRGQVVTAITDGSFSHDRAVATCRLEDGRDLSAEMVRAGLALDWRKFSGGRYRTLEADGIRKKLWRVDARQKGRMPPTA